MTLKTEESETKRRLNQQNRREAAIRNFGEQLLEHRRNNEFASAIAAVSLTAVRSVEIARSVPNVSTMHAALSIPFVRWARDEPRRESDDAQHVLH
jgi:hypothetical protein